MDSDINLASVERNVFRTYTGTGVTDLITGLAVIAFAVAVITEITAIAATAPALIVVFGKLWQQKKLDPVIGSATLARKQQLRLDLGGKLLLFVLMIGGLAAMLLFNLSDMESVIRDNFILVLGSVVAFAMVTMAYIRRDRWFVLYAAVCGLVFALANFIPWRLWIPLLLVGGTMVVAGGMRLSAILRAVRREGLSS